MAATFSHLYMESYLTCLELTTALRLRALLYHHHPLSVHYYSGNYCDAHVNQPWRQVMHPCLVFFKRCMWALVLLPKDTKRSHRRRRRTRPPGATTSGGNSLRNGSACPSPFDPVQLSSLFPLKVGVIHGHSGVQL